MQYSNKRLTIFNTAISIQVSILKLGTEDMHRRLSLYKVLTLSHWNLKTNGLIQVGNITTPRPDLKVDFIKTV